MAQAHQAVFVSDGPTFDYTPGAEKKAGAVIVQGNLVGVTSAPIPSGQLGALRDEGIWRVVKKQEALATVGTYVYWDATGNPYLGTPGSGALTATADSHKFFGATVAAAGANDETVLVRKYGPVIQAVTQHEMTSAKIEDPGDAQAIPVTNSGYCPIVTGGSETRTLATPTFAGQLIALEIKTDGGSCAITASQAINQTGNTIMTMAEARDFILLMGIEVGEALRWQVVANDGVTLS